MADEELVAQFHAMWDGFPGLARLIDARHNVLAANPSACERGFVEGAVCARVGGPDLHRKCKLNRFFQDGQPVTDHVLDDRVRGWMPVAGRDDLCLHFAVIIPEDPSL